MWIFNIDISILTIASERLALEPVLNPVAFNDNGLEPGLNPQTSEHISSGHVPKEAPTTTCDKPIDQELEKNSS